MLFVERHEFGLNAMLGCVAMKPPSNPPDRGYRYAHKQPAK
jgi:hypothetical protein